MKMRKLVLAVLAVAVTVGVNASQITHEQLVKINKFNKNWTNIIAIQNKGRSIKVQQHDILRICRTIFNEKHKVTVVHYKLSCQDLFDKTKVKK
jgi:hypothetical protein